MSPFKKPPIPRPLRRFSQRDPWKKGTPSRRRAASALVFSSTVATWGLPPRSCRQWVFQGWLKQPQATLIGELFDAVEGGEPGGDFQLKKKHFCRLPSISTLVVTTYKIRGFGS